MSVSVEIEGGGEMTMMLGSAGGGGGGPIGLLPALALTQTTNSEHLSVSPLSSSTLLHFACG